MTKKELEYQLKIVRDAFERKMDIIGELDEYFEGIFDELNPNWRFEWKGGMKAYCKEAIKEIKKLKSKK